MLPDVSDALAMKHLLRKPDRLIEQKPFRYDNYLIHNITDEIARSLTYSGVVVDLGCGEAPYRELILSQADAYIGVDWQQSQHDTSRVDVFADLSGDVPLEDGIADTLVSFQVMEHLPEPSRFLSECHRLTRPGGRVYITVPFMWQVHESPHDYFRYTRHGLEYLARKAGLDEIEVVEYTGFWQMWVLKFNYHTRRYAGFPLRYALIPLWVIGQTIAPWLDRIDPHPQEATGYVLKARRAA